LALALFSSPHAYTQIEEEDEEDVESSRMTQQYLYAISIAGFNLYRLHI
jgi:hypothetical protein